MSAREHHLPDCDLVVYGVQPGTRGVVCTCEDDEAPDSATAGAPAIEQQLAVTADPRAPGEIRLVGDAAAAYARYVEAAKRMKLAESAMKEAATAFRDALAAFTAATTA